MKLYLIFDPTDQDTKVARVERTLEMVTTWLHAQDYPAAFHVHEHRIGDDADTIVCVINGDYCWPDPIRTWKGTSRATLKALPLPEKDPGDADRLTLAAERRMGC